MAQWKLSERGWSQVLLTEPRLSMTPPRCDPLHPAGGLPPLLGRGPAEALRPNPGRGLRLPLARVGQRHPRGESGIPRVSLYTDTGVPFGLYIQKISDYKLVR